MSDTDLEIGDRVRYVNQPGRMARVTGEETTEETGRVDDLVEESKWINDREIEQTMAVIDLDDGDEKRVNVGNLDNELGDDEAGASLQILEG